MSRSLRIALVRPPVSVLHKFSKPVENLAINYLAAALRRDGHDVVMLDGMLHDWSDEETAARVLAERPDLVGFTVVLQHFPDNLRNIFRLLRDGGLGAPIVIGGHATSFFPARILQHVPEVTAVVSGEGEQPIRAIAAAIQAGADWSAVPGVSVRDGDGVRSNVPRRLVDLDALGNPARDLVPEVVALDGLVAVSTSRGCYARCSFCSIPRFYGLERGRGLSSGDWLARSAVPAADEIAELHRRFDVLEVLIVDDEFFGGSPSGFERAVAFASRLAELALPVKFALSCRAENVHEEVFEHLQRGGLAHVFIGVETGSPSDLRLYAKGHRVADNLRAVQLVKRMGLTFQPGFMMFNYRSTLRELRVNLEFLREIGEFKPTTINSSVDPHFGVPLLIDMERRGALIDGPLALSARYLDPRVAVIKKVAERCAQAFVPSMNFIAGIRSAVTYEWRRRVPGRSEPDEALLDTFERTVNDKFSQVVLDAVERLESRPDLPADDLHAGVEDALRRVEEDVELARALVILRLSSVEDELRYWSQQDLIAAHRAPVAAAPLSAGA